MKFYQKPWFTVLALILFFPVGLFLMWKNRHFNKVARVVISALLGIIVLYNIFNGDSSTTHSTSTSTQTSTEVKRTLTKAEFEQMYSDPNKFKEYTVDFYAKIFVQPEKNSTSTYFQAFADPEHSEKNTLVRINDPNLDVKTDDIVHIIGTIKEGREGENAFGAKVNAPVIEAQKVEKADYATAFAPTLKSIDIDKEQNQKGYAVKVNKIELAENETRVYVSIANKSKNKINFYTYNSKLVQNGKQFELKDNYQANYTQLQDEILPGVNTEGIILFPSVDIKSGKLKLVLEGSSDNYDITINPFTFDITWNK